VEGRPLGFRVPDISLVMNIVPEKQTDGKVATSAPALPPADTENTQELFNKGRPLNFLQRMR
jgi:hypothetical protein